MIHISKHKKHIISNTFVVGENQTDHEKRLSVCNILQAINNLNDESIVALFGTLDYNKIQVKHFKLDITDKALENDIVTMYSYARTADKQTLSIHITAGKKDRKKEIPIANGSFVFLYKE